MRPHFYKKPLKLTIVPIELPHDKDEINDWQIKYGDTPYFDTIRKYILEDDAYYTLEEVIKINFEQFPIGERERQSSFVAKNESGEIVAWFLCNIHKDIRINGIDKIATYFAQEAAYNNDNDVDFYTRDNEDTIYSMFMQYIVIHPLHQNEGIGSHILREMIFNSEKYVGVKADEFFGYIDRENSPSQSMCRKFGFSFRDMSQKFFQAYATLPELEKKNGITSVNDPNNPQQFGE